jgi:hypothetical protein
MTTPSTARACPASRFPPLVIAGIGLIAACRQSSGPPPSTPLEVGSVGLISTGIDGAVLDGAVSGGHDTPHRIHVSARGRYVAFSSEATNLVAGDTNGKRDVFRVDIFRNRMERGSLGASGAEGNGDSDVAGMSEDGSCVLFLSSATNLVPDDTNGVADAFVANLDSGRVTRVSVGEAGIQGDGETLSASLSGDGRYVAFSSRARNLVAGDDNGFADVFRRDTLNNITVRASLNDSQEESNADCVLPLISQDGSRIAFQSVANNLVAGDLDPQVSTFPWQSTAVQLHATPNSPFDVKTSPLDPDLLFYTDNHPDYGVARVRIQRDALGFATGGVLEDFYQLEGVSGQAPGWDGKWIKRLEILSADATGYKLLLATEEGGADHDGTVDLLDIPNGGGFTATNLVDLTGVRADLGDNYDPEGLALDRTRNLLYVLTDDATDQSAKVYDVDPITGALTATDPDTNVVLAAGEPNATDGIVLPNGDLLALVGDGLSAKVVRLDADDHSVLVAIDLSDLSSVDGPQDLAHDGNLLWVADEQGLVSAWPVDTYSYTIDSTAPVPGWSFDEFFGFGAEIRGMDITLRGELIVTDRTSDAVYCFPPRLTKAFLRDMDTGTTSLVSVGSAGNQANGAVSLTSINSAGDVSIFHSLSSNLAVQTNDEVDIYMHNASTGATSRVSSAGGLEGDGPSMWAHADGSGTCVVFLSEATNLVAGDTNGKRDLLLFRDGGLSRIAVPADGSEPNGNVLAIGFSGDGSHVAFISEATNLVSGDTNELPDLFVYRVD